MFLSLNPSYRYNLLAVINLNNEGVSYLAAKDSESALVAFSGAMQIITQNLWGEIDFEQGPRILKAADLSALARIPVPDMQDEIFYVFDEAFLLSPLACSERSIQPPTRSSIYLVTAFVLFNLCLCAHRNGMQTDDTVNSTAQRFHQHCLQFLEGARGTALEVAVRNNLAHIEWHMRNKADASKSLMSLIPEDLEHILTTEQLNHVLLNMLMVQFSLSITAKAA